MHVLWSKAGSHCLILAELSAPRVWKESLQYSHVITEGRTVLRLLTHTLVPPCCCRAQVAALEQAIHWLSTVVDYVNSNSVASHKEEAQLAQEMSGLLQQKLVLTRQLQSQLASK